MDQVTRDVAIATQAFAPAVDTPGASAPTFVEALVDPASVFRDPAEVVEHPWYTRQEKRAILLSWARDELVLEQVATKMAPDLTPKSRIDAVVEALSQFDPTAAGEYLTAVASIRSRHLRQSARRKRIPCFGER